MGSNPSTERKCYHNSRPVKSDPDLLNTRKIQGKHQQKLTANYRKKLNSRLGTRSHRQGTKFYLNYETYKRPATPRSTISQPQPPKVRLLLAGVAFSARVFERATRVGQHFSVIDCWISRCLKRCVLSIAYGTSSEGVVSNALRLENQQIATISCCKIPAGALLKDNQQNSAATQTQQRRKFSHDANSAAAQIQQRRKFSSWPFLDATPDYFARKTSSSPRSFRIQDSDFSSVSCSEIPMKMAPSVPRTRAAAALRIKQITLDNQGRTIRRLRAQLATERRGLATMKKELEDTQVALEASHKVISGLTEIGLSMSKKIEKMKVKKQLAKANHVECHQKFQARIHEAEDSMQAKNLIIKALVDEKDSLLQTIQGLQEANNAPAPFDGDWEEEPEEEPEEEEIEDIPLGEGEIDDK
ncbi:hypothetical protein F511_37521 [Dorcoceras hygrometricum]|uniref:Uncharacterized protein n=1 Tax=Dorcoceras hygrometricum TaxID=472368 RepID=A0A2Z7BWS8_9LAMI|nr:hypothetical protein F511_37521 [Dorcoceras hygrometricum]